MRVKNLVIINSEWIILFRVVVVVVVVDGSPQGDAAGLGRSVGAAASFVAVVNCVCF